MECNFHGVNDSSVFNGRTRLMTDVLLSTTRIKQIDWKRETNGVEHSARKNGISHPLNSFPLHEISSLQFGVLQFTHVLESVSIVRTAICIVTHKFYRLINYVTSDNHSLFLTEAQSTCHGLVFDGGVPLRLNEEHTIGRGEVQSSWWLVQPSAGIDPTYPTAPVPVVMIRIRRLGSFAKSSRILSRLAVGHSPSIR
jgi:hypothetical protein